MDKLFLNLQLIEENLAKRKKERAIIIKKIKDMLKGDRGDDFSAPIVPIEPKSPTILGGYKKLE